jgi:putative CocE/NonD family hydrolase
MFSRLDDQEASRVLSRFNIDLSRARAELDAAVQEQKGKQEIPLPEALSLLRRYQFLSAHEAMQPLYEDLAAEDDDRRYIIDRKLLIRTPQGAQIAALAFRPKATADPQPTLLNFHIYANDANSIIEARKTAAYGYCAVVAYSRGKGRSPDAPMPYEYDGDDARAVIDWISRQSWSDGRIGMYGGSYAGFTQWAAAKRLPRALRAIMPSVTAVPGIDVPMQGNVFFNFIYPWGPYVTNLKGLDDKTYFDQDRWNALNRAWYVTGKPYRALEQIDGAPNPVFSRWLDHPAYDAYWQRSVPYGKEFSNIDIPVLTTTGYYDGGQVGALYTFVEHYKHRPNANHYLLIGPYDHIGGQRQSSDVLQGYTIDPVARISIQEDLRYQWFDHVLRGGRKPALLQDRINYQVMGSNEWKHAPSLAAMHGAPIRLYLGTSRKAETYQLSDTALDANAFIAQTVDFADRSDVDERFPVQIVDRRLDAGNGLVFVSAPFAKATEVSGLFRGRLDFTLNKRDFDIVLDVYELMPDGEYMQLSASPAYQRRLSYAADRSRRRLLEPGKRQSVEFESERLTSRKMLPGSRLVLVLVVPKNQFQQINYGTGKDVSQESIADAQVPLQIRWFGSSYIDMPIAR